MNHFQRLNEVKELKIFFFAQRANTPKQASSSDALAPTVQNRAGARWSDDTSVQKTSSYITARPWLPGLIVGPCPSEESLCCPARPPAHPVFADSRPLVSNVACLISLYLLSTCMYHTFSHITFLGYNHMNSRASVLLDSLLSEHIIRYHMYPWVRLIPSYHTRFFLHRGCCCQGKEVVPVDHIRGKGLSSCLTSGSKIRLTAGFEPCPQGPALSSFSWSTLSLLMCTLLCAFNTCVSCITLFLGLAASPWLFEGLSFLGLLTICFSPIEQCALVLQGSREARKHSFLLIHVGRPRIAERQLRWRLRGPIWFDWRWFASIKMYGARSRGAARPALLPSALVTWWRVNFRTCGSHSSKTTCPFHGFSAKFKIHAKPAFDRCHACRDPDRSAVIPASQSRSFTAPFEVASGAFRRSFWTKILFFHEVFREKEKDTIVENCPGKRSAKSQGDDRRPLWLVPFRNWHLLYCGYGLACASRPQPLARRDAKVKERQVPSWARSRTACEEGSPWNGRTASSRPPDSAGEKKKIPTSKEKHLRIAEVFFFFQDEQTQFKSFELQYNSCQVTPSSCARDSRRVGHAVCLQCSQLPKSMVSAATVIGNTDIIAGDWPTVTGCPVSNPGNNCANGLLYASSNRLVCFACNQRWKINCTPERVFLFVCTNNVRSFLPLFQPDCWMELCVLVMVSKFNGSNFGLPPSARSTEWVEWVAKLCANDVFAQGPIVWPMRGILARKHYCPARL